MKPQTDRRTVLMVASAVALAAAAGTGAAQPADIRGAVTFAGGAAIPEGQIAIYLEDPTIRDSAQRRIAETQASSDGGSTAIDFTFAAPPGAAAVERLQVVARLERADGWLLARGSAQIDGGAPVSVTLHQAMY